MHAWLIKSLHMNQTPQTPPTVPPTQTSRHNWRVRDTCGSSGVYNPFSVSTGICMCALAPVVVVIIIVTWPSVDVTGASNYTADCSPNYPPQV